MCIESRLIHVKLGEGKEVVVILRAGKVNCMQPGSLAMTSCSPAPRHRTCTATKTVLWSATAIANEVNSDYQDKLQDGGLIISSVSANEGLVEIIELAKHPFYVGAQFHPEFLSKPNHPHPSFSGFVAVAFERTALEDSHEARDYTRRSLRNHGLPALTRILSPYATASAT